ncbi:hypothetical protein P5V15_007705 [Pogonomyrmex californicus]
MLNSSRSQRAFLARDLDGPPPPARPPPPFFFTTDGFLTAASALLSPPLHHSYKSRLCPSENYLLPHIRPGIKKRAKGVSSLLPPSPDRDGGERPARFTPSAFTHKRACLRVLISHPHDTALRGRSLSENRFEHTGPRTFRMPFDNAAASVNGDSLAFGFSRPRYAAFRIKPGFTRRCKEKLNTLAISVMNQWPGIKLRVTEAWDEDGMHASDSLHYEGRAVDVTTSDRDRAKYGMLARLAVEAGFDWVYYESRSHIHCSVKSESSSAGKSGGCFPGKSLVRTEDGGTKRLDEVRLGERIAALDSRGDVVYSEVIAFLDRSPSERRQFIRLTTKSGRVLTLTPAHLVPVEGRSSVFAASVQPGDRIIVSDHTGAVGVINEVDSQLRWDTVVETKLVLEEGVYAPLTMEGTLVVDDVVASCYAVVNSQSVAHYSFLPLRLWHSVASFFVQRLGEPQQVARPSNASRTEPTTGRGEGVHWYASMLYSMSSYVLPSTMLYN